MRIHPRRLARMLADWLGYFWLPCTICGEPYAGFEWKRHPDHTLMLNAHEGIGVCPKQSCGTETRRRNALLPPEPR